MAGIYAVTLQFKGKKKVVKVVEYSHSRAASKALSQNPSALYDVDVSLLQYCPESKTSEMKGLI